MGNTPDLDEIFMCLKQMESTVLGLRQLRGLIGKGPGREMLDALIVEAEEGIAEIKRKITQ